MVFMDWRVYSSVDRALRGERGFVLDTAAHGTALYCRTNDRIYRVLGDCDLDAPTIGDYSTSKGHTCIAVIYIRLPETIGPGNHELWKRVRIWMMFSTAPRRIRL